jgi:nucleoside-diphosphate-sugar epimerase
MKILLTGSQGYIGSVLHPILLSKGFEVFAVDAGFFAECSFESLAYEDATRRLDIRDISESDLAEVDAIIHLAALSNDPLGEMNASLTDQINRDATIQLASLAKSCGVRRFVFASSQSMYGISDACEELDEYSSLKRPITAYARTKWESEQALVSMTSPGFEVVCFRPSTVFGVSPRLRCDIVFNNLVACAYATKKIEIKSDGTPWRPVIHVRDVCDALIAGIIAPASVVSGRAYNVGILGGNYTVRDLAEAASKVVPGCELVFTGEHGKDSRSYRVSFRRIFDELGQWYQPSWSLDRGGLELVEFFSKHNFSEIDFRADKTNRLPRLLNLISQRKLDSNLFWN